MAQVWDQSVPERGPGRMIRYANGERYMERENRRIPQSPRQATEAAGKTRPVPDYVTNPPPRRGAAEDRYRANLGSDAPNEPRRFFHTSETRPGQTAQQLADSFKERGIIGSERTSFGAGRQVFAHPEAPRELRPNQVYVDFEESRKPSGRGTSFMGRGPASTAVSFENDVPAERIRGVYGYTPEGNIGRLADAGSTTVGLMSLLGQAAQFIPGFSERFPRTTWLANGGPMGDLLNEVIASNYAPGGVMDPYKDMRDMAGWNPATGTVAG